MTEKSARPRRRAHDRRGDRPTKRGGLKVREAMTASAVTAPPSATLEEVAQLMLSERVGCVVIVDADDRERPEGIVTETDFEVTDDPIPFTFFHWPKLFGKYVWSESSMEDMYALARSQTAESIMSTPLLTVDVDAELWEAVRVMVANDVKRVPAVRDGRLVGIVTRHDLLKCLVAEPAGTGSA